MRKMTVSILAIALTMATGCVIAIGTGRHSHTPPEGTHIVDIEGTAYVVDLHAGTVREVGEETVIGIETSDD